MLAIFVTQNKHHMTSYYIQHWPVISG
jgi:hypothetical protein